MDEKILITIETAGPVYEKYGIIGPITKPFLEDKGTVVRMVMNGIKVKQHSEKGEGEPKLLKVSDVRSLTIGTRVIADNKLQEAELARIKQIADKKQKDVESREEKVSAAADKLAAKAEKNNKGEETDKAVVVQTSAQSASKPSKQEQKAPVVNDAPKEDRVEKK